MVVACCRFLCYFCRTSRLNQRAMFDHLIFILEHANILLSRPSLRGSTPLDVAYSSLMDNTELALALREHYLEKIAVYLSRCGLTSNTELVLFYFYEFRSEIHQASHSQFSLQQSCLL